MKKIIAAFLIFIFGVHNAQTGLEKVADAVCKKLSEPDFFSTVNSREQVYEIIGIEMLQQTHNFKNQIEKEEKTVLNYQNLDEKLTNKLGVFLATKCPNALMAVDKLPNEKKDEDDNDEEEVHQFNGTIKNVIKGDFYTLEIEKDKKETQKFLVLWDIDGKEIFLNNNWKDKKVSVNYLEINLLTTKNNEPEKFNIIDSLSFTE